MSSNYFPCHTHTAYSILDGMGKVSDMVTTVAELGQPAVAMTDHGTMAGVVQGYKSAKKKGLLFYPGSEMYVVRDVSDPETRGQRFHLGMMALDFKGYQALVKLSTLSFQEGHFYKKPLIDFSDLAFLKEEGFSKHLAVTTGCYAGLVINEWSGNRPEHHAATMIDMLARWFPNLYVELQNHGIQWNESTHDLDIASHLYEIATDKGIPVVLGNDSHYVHDNQQSAHNLMKSICYFGLNEDDGFKGGPYSLLDAERAMGVFPKTWHDDIEAGFEDLLSKNKLSIPALDNYKFHVPSLLDGNPDTILERMAKEGLREKKLDKVDVYVNRLEEELHVIKTMGMSNYFILIKTHVTDWCRENDVIINTRGSANGSLLCYLIGITMVDAIKWRTSFSRFISLDRMKPPDIDIDVDFRGREKLIAHLLKVFPSMTQVATYAKVGMSTNDDGEEVGSVVVQYKSAMRRKVEGRNKKARERAAALGIKYDVRDDEVYQDVIAQEHSKPLWALSEIEVYKSLGTNAAGFILPSEDLPIKDYLPLARVVSSNTTVTQFPKDDVEALGYLKIDILGLRLLQTINGCLSLIGKKINDWDWIPEDDPEACKLLRSGRGIGIFQFEGFSMSHGGREMGIKSTLDVILSLALYRPALMNGGQKNQYLKNRRLPKSKQERLPTLFDEIVSDTAGVPLYQEQIMEILRTIGMEFKEYNELMSAIKASNGSIHGAKDTFARLEPMFYDLCDAKGLSDQESLDVWNAVVGFTEYGFNRSHSTSYGLMAYRSAYLKAHYPLEYMASIMDVWADRKEKIAKYSAEVRRLGLYVVKADVNYSEVSWTVDKARANSLRKGLLSLDGVGEAAAKAIVDERKLNGPFTSVQDFIDRTPRRPVTGGRDYAKKGTLTGVCKTLMESGAFRTIMETE